MHETFDHTADLGLRAQAGDLNHLFADIGHALMSSLVDDPTTIQPRETRTVTIDGSDREYLLYDWLAALLGWYHADQFLAAEFTVEVGPNGLTATVRGEPADAERHPLSHEVKAITYHGLRVEATPDGYLAEAIVDI
jgi:SHS2 domain-containing protein